MATNVEKFIDELDAGVFAEKLSQMLSDAAGATIDHGRKSKVIIELTMEQIASSHQVNVTHVLKYERPTGKGDIRERNKTATPMYVGSRGALSFFPENQSQMFTKQGGVARDGERFPNNVDPDTGEMRR
jgi:hypothetical protein